MAGEPRWSEHRDEEMGGGTPVQAGVGTVAQSIGWQADDARIERALGALPIGLLVTDATGRVVYQNHFAAQFSEGRHGDALVEVGIEDVVHRALIGSVTEETIDLYGPPPRNLQLRASPTYEEPGSGEVGGEVTGAVVLVEDVTVARHIDRVRRDFVANVSHELRTPVGAIGILAETLRDADDPEIVDRLAGRLHNEALRLGQVIEDLLALSKLESGPIEDPVPINLDDVAALAVERAAQAAEHRDIVIDVVQPSGGPVYIAGDQAQMVSAVANLLDNAVKYSDPGSTVAVTVDRDGPDAVIAVVDSGVGIPASAHQRIFERFYRVDDARSRATGGTGLGLSIVRHVAINHRGAVSVASVEGQGSTFTIRIPALVDGARSTSGPEAVEGPGPSATGAHPDLSIRGVPDRA